MRTKNCENMIKSILKLLILSLMVVVSCHTISFGQQAGEPPLNSSVAPLFARITNVIPDEYKSHPDYGVTLNGFPGSYELIHKRERFKKIYYRGENEFSTLQSFWPIHYKNEQGQWIGIDTTGTHNASEKTFGVVKSDLPTSWNYETDEVEQALVPGKSVKYLSNKMLFADNIQGLNPDSVGFFDRFEFSAPVDGNTANISFERTVQHDASVKDYWPGVDKTVTHRNYGQVKTNYILKERLPEFYTSNYLVIQEEVELPEGWSIVNMNSSTLLTVYSNTGERDVVYIDENGEKMGGLSAPTYFHSSKDNFQLKEEVYEIEDLGNQKYRISFSIPTDFLKNDSTIYPVIIDPSSESSTINNTPTNYVAESAGCQRTQNVNVGGTTVLVTATRALWRITARNGAVRSNQRSRFIGPNSNSVHYGSGGSGTHIYDRTGSYANGLRVGNIGFTLRAWRTWGNLYTRFCGRECCSYCDYWWGCQCYCTRYCWEVDGCGTRYQYITSLYIRVDWEYPCTNPTAPTNITSSAGNTICEGTTTTLSVGGGSNGSGATYQWFAGSCGSAVIGTGTSINVTPSSSTTYLVRRVGTASGCTIATGCASRTITVQTSPVAPTTINGEGTGGRTSICEGSSITLTAAGGSNGSGATYQWYANGCGSGGVLGTGASITVTPAATGTTYYVRRRGSTSCTGSTGCIFHTVYTRPNPLPNPTSGGITSSVGTSICEGTTTTLTVTDGYSAFYQFNGNYSDAGPDNLNLGAGGGLITGNAYEISGGGLRESPATNILNTDYYTLDFDLRITSSAGSWSRFFAYRGAFIGQSPGLWRYPGESRIQWRHSPGNSGINEAFTYSVNQWYHITMEKEGTTCRLFIDGDLYATGTVPLKGDASGPLQFGNGGGGVSIDNFKIYSGAIRWYNGGSCSGAVVGYGPQFDITPNSTTTYSARVIGECDNSTCVSKTITVNTAPTAYAGPNLDNCNTSSYTLPGGASVTGSYSSYNWTYTVNSGSVSSVTGTSTLTPTINPSSATGSVTLTLTAVGVAPCSDDTDEMTFTWASGPTSNAGPDIGQCGTSNMTFSGASASSPSTFTWTVLGGGTGSGTIVGSGSVPSNYSFSPISASGQKTVRLSVTGSGTCGSTTVTDDVVVTWDEPLTVSTTSPQNSCTGQANINVTPATINGTYSSINWSAVSGDGTGSITAGGSTASPTFEPTTDAGDYFLTITLTGGGECASTNPSSTMSVVWETPPTADAGGNLNVCENGSIAMTGSSINTGGLASSFTWVQIGGSATGSFTTTSATDPTAWVWTPASIGTATLQLQIIGSGACSSTTTTSNRTVTVQALPVANAGSDLVNCGGGDSFVMTGASGTAISSYTWSESGGFGTWNQGGTVPTATFDPTAGSGTTSTILTVQGTGACSAESDSDTREVTWYTPPNINSVSSADITDCGTNNGAIFVIANGDDPLEYSINNGSTYQSSPEFTSLSAGNYTIIVRDANNCTTAYTSNPVVVNDVPPISLTLGVDQNVLCAGSNGGAIEVSGISGGEPVYMYGLNGASSSRFDTVIGDPFLITGLPAGTYDIIIRDQFGCTSNAIPTTITEPDPIIIGTPTIVDIVGCGGSGVGSISVTASGGTGTLNYYLNDIPNSPVTSGSWTGLVGGSYDIGVRDAEGCRVAANSQINAPWILSAGNDINVCSGETVELQGEIIGEYPNSCSVACSSGCGLQPSCTASGNSFYDWISGVQFNTINNASGQNTYTDFTNISTTVTEGSTYALSVEVSQAGSGGYRQYVRVFFDWNRDGDFEDANESYDLGSGIATPFSVSQNITIPDAVAGNVRMRVTECWLGYFLSPGCGVIEYSAVEDYTINVQELEACSPIISWSQGGNAYNSTVSPTSNTTYTLTVDDGDGCVQSATVDVNVSDLDAVETLTQVSCNAADDGCIEINAVDEVGPYLMKMGTDIQVFGGRMKPVTINNTNGTLTNHPVKITNVAYTAPMRADFADVRFYDSDLNELVYWIESYTNSTTMDVWVRFPSLPNGNTIIYMVFGNSSLTTESNGEAVFEFFDDFNYFDSSKWTQGTISGTTGSNWSYYGGQLIGGNSNRTQTSTATFTGSRISEARTYETSSAGNGFTTAGFWGSTGNSYNILNHNGGNFMCINGTWDGFPSIAGGQRDLWIREYVRAHTSNSLGSRTREIGGTSSQVNGNYSLNNERIRLGARGDNIDYNQNFSAQWDWMFVRPWVANEPTASVGAVALPDNQFCDLAPDNYSVQVVDMGNCSETINFTITEPTVLTIDGVSVTNTWCYSNNQGELDITVSGGTPIIPSPSYLYNWAGPASFSSSLEDPTGLAGGIYSVTVADNNTCTTSSTVTVGINSPDNAPPSFTWRGTVDNDWTNPGNWDCGIPDATAPVIIPASPSGGNRPIIYNGDIGECLNIEIQGNIFDLLEIQNGGLLNLNQ